MGMYDTICAKVVCPKCKKETEVYDQIKWRNNTSLTDFQVGDIIVDEDINGNPVPLEDGEYKYGSYLRPQLIGTCEHCNEKFPFAVKIKDGKITDIYPVDDEVIDIKKRFEEVALNIGSKPDGQGSVFPKPIHSFMNGSIKTPEELEELTVESSVGSGRIARILHKNK